MQTHPPRRTTAAFSLIEIMVVVVIIGLLAAIGIPAFQKVRSKALVNTFVNDLRTIEKAVEMYETENGRALQNYEVGIHPVDLVPYLKSPDFAGNTPLGGQWDWDNHNTYYRISVIPMDAATVQLVDTEIDDGDSSTGLVRFNGGFRYYTWNAP